VENILTSSGIQKYYINVKARSDMAIDAKYRVIDAEM
jgi:hypothetical protein